MKAELEQFRVESDGFWNALPVMGCSGYDAMELAEKKKWHALPCWGSQGWDLGSWPLVIVFVRNREKCFDVIEYVEGDTVAYCCPTSEIREQIINEIAFFHWKWNKESWVKDFNSVEELPEDLKGPYRR